MARNSGRLSASALATLGEDLLQFLESVGARSRRRRKDGERAIDFGKRAAEKALLKAGLEPSDIDVLIYASVSRGFIEPATANVFQSTLGMDNATCFDVLDACAGWVRGLDVADSLLRSGKCRNAMILNCEFNWDEYYPAIDALEQMDELAAGFTIGEAATATIVGDEAGSFEARFANVGRGSALCQIPLPSVAQFSEAGAPDPRPPLQFYAQSGALHRMTLRALSQRLREAPDFSRDNYDISFGHSAGLPATRKVAELLDMDLDRHYEIFPQFGNTVSASVPLAMSLAEEEGRLKRGDRVLLVVGSAGVTAALARLVF